MQLSTWQKRVEAAAGGRGKPIGYSPGGVAAELGISRQAVHYLIRKGKLDVDEVYDGVRLAFYVIPPPSLEAYKERYVQALRDRLQSLE